MELVCVSTQAGSAGADTIDKWHTQDWCSNDFSNAVGGQLHVDLGAIASTGFAVQGSRDMVGTLLPLFMRRKRCESLNDLVPASAVQQAMGLSKLLCLGELPIVVQGGSVVLPFATDEKAEAISAWLTSGTGVFTWEYLLTGMPIGLFHVDVISNSSYVVTFQKRLAGQGPVGDDETVGFEC